MITGRDFSGSLSNRGKQHFNCLRSSVVDRDYFRSSTVCQLFVNSFSIVSHQIVMGYSTNKQKYFIIILASVCINKKTAYITHEVKLYLFDTNKINSFNPLK